MDNGRSQTIRALYGAASGTQPWAQALDQLADYTDSRCITLDTYDLNAHCGEVLASNMAPHPAIEEYNRVYGQRNLLIESAYSNLRIGQLFRASQFVSMRDFRQSELFNSVYRALDIGFVAGVPLEFEACSRVTQFSLIKPSDADDFSDAELHRLGELKPHLEQAWAGYRHLSRLQARLDTLTSLWDACEHAVMVIDDQLKVHFANRAADHLFARVTGMNCHHGTLKLDPPGQHEQFRQQVRTVTRGSSSMMPLAGSHGAGPKGLLATLFRLPDSRIALIITDPARSATGFHDGLRQRFNMTSSEADLVNAVIAGDSLRQFAESREVCYETARTHLKNVMRKNGWRRQTEMLADVLATLLPPGMFRSELS